MDKEPLKICILGAAKSSHTYMQCGILRDFGHEVTLVSPDDGNCPEGVHHISCAVENFAGIAGKIRWLVNCYKVIRHVDADVFNAHYAAELTTWMAWLVGKKPLIISCLGGDVLFEEQGTQGPIGQWLTKRALKACNHVTTVSNYLGDTVKTFGVPASKITRVVWGVNRTIFYADNTDNEKRTEWGLPEDAFVIFSPRMLKPLYNQPVMLEALAKVVEKHPKAVLVLSTYNQDAGFRETIETQAKQLGLVKHVVFAPPMDQQGMMQAYNAADIALSLSPSDGTPVSVMEAMACKTPVIMSDLERYKEFFTHKESGWFTPIDTDKVAEALDHLIEDKMLYSSIQDGGAKVVMKKADLHGQTRLIEDLAYRFAAAE